MVTYKTEKVSTKVVQYTGTDVLKTGYALCYDRVNNAAKDAQGKTLDATKGSFARFSNVSKPAVGNLYNFAGIVAPGVSPRSGPCQVKIVIPTGGSVDVFTDQNCTQNATLLCVQAGSYAFGGLGTGPVLGFAIQTIDRATTNGTVQSLARMPDIFRKPFGDSVPSSSVNTFSPAMWESCPVNEIRENPALGYLYEFDPMAPVDPTDGHGYDITQVTSGVIAAAGGAGGGLLIDSGGNASSDDGINVEKLGADWLPAAGKKLWFEGRISLSDITGQYFFGLHDADNAIIAAGLAAVSSDNLIGFYRDAGTAAAKLEFASCKINSSDIQATAATVANGAEINLGFIVDGITSITPYINGVAGTPITNTSTIPVVAMLLAFVAQVEGTTADAEMTIRSLRVAQLR